MRPILHILFFFRTIAAQQSVGAYQNGGFRKEAADTVSLKVGSFADDHVGT